MNALDLIRAERQRQIDAEGWSAAHDDSHDQGELAEAAAWLASPARIEHHDDERALIVVAKKIIRWPWDDGVTQHSRIDVLTKAGALIAAEIDRLQRAEKAQP